MDLSTLSLESIYSDNVRSIRTDYGISPELYSTESIQCFNEADSIDSSIRGLESGIKFAQVTLESQGIISFEDDGSTDEKKNKFMDKVKGGLDKVKKGVVEFFKKIGEAFRKMFQWIVTSIKGSLFNGQTKYYEENKGKISEAMSKNGGKKIKVSSKIKSGLKPVSLIEAAAKASTSITETVNSIASKKDASAIKKMWIDLKVNIKSHFSGIGSTAAKSGDDEKFDARSYVFDSAYEEKTKGGVELTIKEFTNNGRLFSVLSKDVTTKSQALAQESQKALSGLQKIIKSIEKDELKDADGVAALRSMVSNQYQLNYQTFSVISRLRGDAMRSLRRLLGAKDKDDKGDDDK